METNEKDFLYWVTSSGLYKKELLEKDLEKLAAFYYNRGYLKVKVGDPEVKHEGDWLYITIPIDEGLQYPDGSGGYPGRVASTQGEIDRRLGHPKRKIL